MTFTITMNDGTTHDLPSKKVVCHDCGGHGTVLNPSMREHAYTAEEFADFSDEERHAYFNRGGMFDVTCPTCHGKNVVDEPNLQAFTNQHHKVYRKWEKERREEENFQAMWASEIRNGA